MFLSVSPPVNNNVAISDQKISKFFVPHMEESMAGHVGMVELGRGITKGT
jgi:hypothetical protein